MPDSPLRELDLDSDQLQLLEAKMGSLLTWKDVTFTPAVGPYDPDVLPQFAERRQIMLDQCVEKLRSYSSEEIAVILRDPQDRATIANTWAGFNSRELDWMHRETPVWYAAGWGHPDHVADFDYWSRMSAFTVAELTCLTVGISPSEFSAKKLDNYCTTHNRDRFYPSLEFLIQRYEQFCRIFGYDERRQISPSIFL